MIFIVLLPTAALVLMNTLSANAAQLNRTDGGYENLRVAIAENIPYHPNLLVNLKALIRQASQFLLVATQGNFYFKDVEISIPKMWPSTDVSDKVWEDQYDRAQVQVTDAVTKPATLDPTRTSDKDPNPVQLPPGFLIDLNGTTTATYKKPEYYFVHHWANHRYGVMPEYATSPESQFYCSGGRMNVTRCSEMISVRVKDSAKGKCPSLNTCGPSPTTCDVTFYRDPHAPATESIMFLPYIDGVKFFCGQDTHNPDADNMQNHRHNHKSTWDVIKQHSDFAGLAKLTVNRKVHTSFRLVQKADKFGKRLVLAMDVSNSMTVFNRSTFLKFSVGHLIRHSISFGQHVGIVTFAGKGMLFRSLVEVNSSDTREQLATIVATMGLFGGTCIGCGLRDGVRVLEENNSSASGGTIILVSDGEENYAPYIVDVLPEVVRKGVTVHTFALGAEADQKLQDVALQTGGTAYAFGDLQTNAISELTLSFVLSTTWNLDKAQQPVIMMDATTSFSHRIEFPFTIQEELGNNTFIFISFLEPQNITAELFDGSGKPCVAECPMTATDLSISVNLPTTSATESWKLVLSARGSQASNVTVAVLSTQRDPLKAPIRAETCVKHDPVTNQALIYTRVTKDGYAVLNAKAVATVDYNGTTGRVLLPLYDHGKGPDIIKNDGEYSAFFTELQGKGRYSVRTDVTITQETRLSSTAPGASMTPGLPGLNESLSSPVVSEASAGSVPPGIPVASESLKTTEFTQTFSRYKPSSKATLPVPSNTSDKIGFNTTLSPLGTPSTISSSGSETPINVSELGTLTPSNFSENMTLNKSTFGTELSSASRISETTGTFGTSDSFKKNKTTSSYEVSSYTTLPAPSSTSERVEFNRTLSIVGTPINESSTGSEASISITQLETLIPYSFSENMTLNASLFSTEALTGSILFGTTETAGSYDIEKNETFSGYKTTSNTTQPEYFNTSEKIGSNKTSSPFSTPENESSTDNQASVDLTHSETHVYFNYSKTVGLNTSFLSTESSTSSKHPTMIGTSGSTKISEKNETSTWYQPGGNTTQPGLSNTSESVGFNGSLPSFSISGNGSSTEKEILVNLTYSGTLTPFSVSETTGLNTSLSSTGPPTLSIYSRTTGTFGSSSISDKNETSAGYEPMSNITESEPSNTSEITVFNKTYSSFIIPENESSMEHDASVDYTNPATYLPLNASGHISLNASFFGTGPPTASGIFRTTGASDSTEITDGNGTFTGYEPMSNRTVLGPSNTSEIVGFNRTLSSFITPENDSFTENRGSVDLTNTLFNASETRGLNTSYFATEPLTHSGQSSNTETSEEIKTSTDYEPRSNTTEHGSYNTSEEIGFNITFPSFGTSENESSAEHNASVDLTHSGTYVPINASESMELSTFFLGTGSHTGSRQSETTGVTGSTEISKENETSAVYEPSSIITQPETSDAWEPIRSIEISSSSTSPENKSSVGNEASVDYTHSATYLPLNVSEHIRLNASIFGTESPTRSGIFRTTGASDSTEITDENGTFTGYEPRSNTTVLGPSNTSEIVGFNITLPSFIAPENYSFTENSASVDLTITLFNASETRELNTSYFATEPLTHSGQSSITGTSEENETSTDYEPRSNTTEQGPYNTSEEIGVNITFASFGTSENESSAEHNASVDLTHSGTYVPINASESMELSTSFLGTGSHTDSRQYETTGVTGSTEIFKENKTSAKHENSSSITQPETSDAWEPNRSRGISSSFITPENKSSVENEASVDLTRPGTHISFSASETMELNIFPLGTGPPTRFGQFGWTENSSSTEISEENETLAGHQLRSNETSPANTSERIVFNRTFSTFSASENESFTENEVSAKLTPPGTYGSGGRAPGFLSSERSGVSTLKGHSSFAEHSAASPGRLLLSELKSDMEGGETCKASSSAEECRSPSHVESESRRRLPGALIYQGATGGSEIGLVSFGGVFQVKENATKEDLPPAPVRDLKVLGVKKKDGKVSVKLSWTCMGAHLDSENATLTDLRASLNTRELIYRFDNATPILAAHILEGSLTPLSPYEVQAVRIQLPHDLVSTSGGKPGSIRLGLRIQNERGVFSPVSNVVPVVWNTRPKPSPATSTTATNKPHSIASKRPPAGNVSTTLSSKGPQTASEATPTTDSNVPTASATTTSTETTWVVPTDDDDPEVVYTKSKSRTSYVTLLAASAVAAVITAMVVIGIYAVLCREGGKRSE